jgi:hypothetical protein
MGLKGYRLWVMGHLDSTCRAPPRRGEGLRRRCAPAPAPAPAPARRRSRRWVFLFFLALENLAALVQGEVEELVRVLVERYKLHLKAKA